ncbi:Protein of unknown function [Pyronema omphalodes CBS 100304]|uniref:Uncharacterized protein n=1 Tax=Pyronema omphalodes (strain CBS 100304) TaxID=1076935 RepID=U4KWI0_PYROM|nr:Protein of unknown function [Pyronema omphalodes CBS 100304]
MRTLLRPSSS